MSDLPSGTVTFLFTDIEGSTQLWERYPEPMRSALTRHDTLLRSAIEQHAGHVFKTVGDAFCATFATAPQALLAAVAAQRALHAEPWTGIEALHVRMALHTGTVDAQAGDYFGPPLNRIARLLAAGHGGQILLSQATYDLVRDQLPLDVNVHDLGEHRLKDLIRPEHIYHLITPDVPHTFPALRTLEARPHNLPVHLTPVLGRAQELAALTNLLHRDDVRLITLTGPGGTGKTRLALQLAADVLDRFPAGVFFVNLAPISDPALVPRTIATVLDLRDASGQSLLETLQAALHERHCLLVLDNFEQVVEAAPIVLSLLTHCPQLRVLATSRVPLHLRGEREFAVPPLPTPDLQRLSPSGSTDVAAVTQYAAVALFIARAVETKADFQVSHRTAPVIAEICHRLDGLPLAIELAAARIKVLAPEALLQRLDRRLRVLTGGARDLPTRQQTLRNAIAWSYDLLDPVDQALFRRLAVFVGGCTVEAAEAIGNAEEEGPLDVLDGLASLTDKSLLRQEESAEGEPRFAMLETIREYAWEQLELCGEAPAVRERHAGYYLALAHVAEPQLRGPDQQRWLDRLEAEHDNLRSALRWTQLETGNPGLGLDLAGALTWFWYRRGYFSEGRRWLEDRVARNSDAPAAARAKALNGLGALARRQGDFPGALAPVETALALYRDLGDPAGLAWSHNLLGLLAWHRGDYDQATALLEAALPLYRQVGDRWGIAITLHHLANVVEHQADYTRAASLYTDSLALLRDVGDQWSMSSVLNNLGTVAHYQGDYDRAATLYTQSLTRLRVLGDRRGIATALNNLGEVAHIQGDYPRAGALYAESLVGMSALGDRRGIASALKNLGRLAKDLGEDARAVSLLGAVAALREALGIATPPADQGEATGTIAELHERLGDLAFTRLWASGRAMPLEEALAEAQRVLAAVAQPI